MVTPHKLGFSFSTPSLRKDAYYLECRKDAQCDCILCRASINATLDLRPSPSTPFSCSTAESCSPLLSKHLQWSPYAAVPSTKSRNPSRFRSNCDFPCQNSPSKPSTASKFVGRFVLAAFLLCLGVFTAFNFLAEPRLSHETFTKLVKESFSKDVRVSDRLEMIQRHVWAKVGASMVYNCSGDGTAWKLAEESQILHSSCEIYSSYLEEVTVWGYTSKTGGVLKRYPTDRTFVVLSGRILEWQEGQIQFILHPQGSSWTMPKWAASAIVLEGNTWILEYKRTTLSEGFGGIHGFLRLANARLVKILRRVKLQLDTAFLNGLPGSNYFDGKRLRSSRLRPT